MEINQIDLMLDRQQYAALRTLSIEILKRLQAIEVKYKPGTFDGDGELTEVEVIEVVEETPEAPRVIRRKSKTAKHAPRQPKPALSDAVRAELASKGHLDIHEFHAANPHFTKNNLYPVLRYMHKAGKARQDREVRSLYYAV